MSTRQSVSIPLQELRQRQPRFRGLEAGHRACQGCGQALAARLVAETGGPDVAIANATGCLEVFTTAYPQSAWRLPWLHSVFANGAAVASGMDAALRMQGKPTKVIAMAGDGGTFDIGFQALSGMIERGHNVLFICYDNEGYMNTGIQRSGSTPHAAATTTSPAGAKRLGKRHYKKDIVSIVAAHHMPYAATASVAYVSDLRKKVREAFSIEGPTFIQIYAPCPLGWAHDSAATIEVARLAVQCGLFPLLEIEDGEVVGVMPIRERHPVTEFLALQGRFKHLFTGSAAAQEELEHLQAIADHQIERYGLCTVAPDAFDTEGGDTVRRGGAWWG